ncbi:hypothetical protein L1887_42137 [Cichorium endivia]|nr:hypothetical protein L1887_42137 [Cichorium endivia]
MVMAAMCMSLLMQHLGVRQVASFTRAAQQRVLATGSAGQQFAGLCEHRVGIVRIGGEAVGALCAGLALLARLARLVPVVGELDHDAHIDAAKVGRHCDLKGKLLRKDASDEVGGIAEHPLCKEDGREAVDRAAAVVFVELGRLCEEPDGKGCRAQRGPTPSDGRARLASPPSCRFGQSPYERSEMVRTLSVESDKSLECVIYVACIEVVVG